MGIFSVPLGLLALAGAWRRAQGFGWSSAAPVGEALGLAGLMGLALCSAAYLLKALRYPGVVRAEFSHPLLSAVSALPLLVMLMAVVLYGESSAALLWLPVALVLMGLQGWIALRVVALVATNQADRIAITPALYLPPVAGSFIGGMAFQAIGYQGWGAMLFGMGLAGWALLEARVLHRLFEAPLPEPMRATIGIELAPPAVATLTASVLWPQLPADVLVVGVGIAMAPVVAVLVRWDWWRHTPFSIGFWSFSFPLAALASDVIEVVKRGHWPAEVAGAALAAVCGVYLFLMVRTLGLLRRKA
jgi:tellurite resistance protein